MTDQPRGSHDIDFEVGKVLEKQEIQSKKRRSLVIRRLSYEDGVGVDIPRAFELMEVGSYWFAPKVEDDNGDESERSRPFQCIAEHKDQLDEWISELASGDHQTIYNVFLLDEDINVEWDTQSEKLIFMP